MRAICSNAVGLVDRLVELPCLLRATMQRPKPSSCSLSTNSDAVDAGGLDDSWRQQPGTPVYTTDLDAEGVRKALSAARRQRTPDWTATPKSPGNFANPA